MEQAIQAVQVHRRIPLRFVEVELEEAVKIAGAQGIYAYDAYLIRCAEKYKAPLISLDGGLLAAVKETGVRIIEVEG